MDDIDFSRYLPLSEATFYVLACLHEPLHGYAIMQKVDALSEGSVSIGPGTLYGAFATLEKQGLVVKVREEERRKVYGMTALGRVGVPDDIGPMIANLLGQDNRWINGQRIEVSGGQAI